MGSEPQRLTIGGAHNRKLRNVDTRSLMAGIIKETFGPNFSFWEEKESERPRQMELYKVKSVPVIVSETLSKCTVWATC